MSGRWSSAGGMNALSGLKQHERFNRPLKVWQQDSQVCAAWNSRPRIEEIRRGKAVRS
jgi:hypothetical protein